jgi:hypothetical protein
LRQSGSARSEVKPAPRKPAAKKLNGKTMGESRMTHPEWSADIPICGFTGLFSPGVQELPTGKSPERAGWKACATDATQFDTGYRSEFSHCGLGLMILAAISF